MQINPQSCGTPVPALLVGRLVHGSFLKGQHTEQFYLTFFPVKKPVHFIFKNPFDQT